MNRPREDAFLGRGWAFPPALSAGGAGVEMVAGEGDIRESLQILLGTVPGERVMQESFGCDLQSQLFEEPDEGLVNTIQRLVEDAIVEHEPRVDLEQVDVSRSAASAACVVISVRYTVRGTNTRYNMVYPFYLMEATLQG